jgi:hypothetical protein
MNNVFACTFFFYFFFTFKIIPLLTNTRFAKANKMYPISISKNDHTAEIVTIIKYA